MKRKVVICAITTIVIWGIMSASYVLTNYVWERDYGSKWELADRASTIKAKADLVTDFLSAIEQSPQRFSDHNAIFLQTDQNSLKNNLSALRTLSLRLEEISTMDPRSPEYQWAIQQITGQEQGEAEGLIGTIKGCYFLRTCAIVWGWIAVIFGVIPVVLWIVVFVMYMRQL
jgi:hypothetical protein